MPRQLSEAKEGDEVLYFSHNSPQRGVVHRFTKTLIIVRVDSSYVIRGYSECRIHKKDGREQGGSWNRVELPTPEEWAAYQKAVDRFNLVKQLQATKWGKLTTETLEGIERIADCLENKIK